MHLGRVKFTVVKCVFESNSKLSFIKDRSEEAMSWT